MSPCSQCDTTGTNHVWEDGLRHLHSANKVGGDNSLPIFGSVAIEWLNRSQVPSIVDEEVDARGAGKARQSCSDFGGLRDVNDIALNAGDVRRFRVPNSDLRSAGNQGVTMARPMPLAP